MTTSTVDLDAVVELLVRSRYSTAFDMLRSVLHHRALDAIHRETSGTALSLSTTFVPVTGSYRFMLSEPLRDLIASTSIVHVRREQRTNIDVLELTGTADDTRTLNQIQQVLQRAAIDDLNNWWLTTDARSSSANVVDVYRRQREHVRSFFDNVRLRVSPAYYLNDINLDVLRQRLDRIGNTINGSH